MKSVVHAQVVSTYDPRWFIWTIVFLIVSGVSLVSYILITSTNEVNSSVELSTTFLKIHSPKKVN